MNGIGKGIAIAGIWLGLGLLAIGGIQITGWFIFGALIVTFVTLLVWEG